MIDIQEFTTSGTWNKPGGAQIILAYCIGGGAGGGGGRKNGTVGVNGTNVTGGSGASGGGIGYRFFPADAFPSSLAITVGAGGAGVAGTMLDASGGTVGTVGGPSYLPGLLYAQQGDSNNPGVSEPQGGTSYGGVSGCNGGSAGTFGFAGTDAEQASTVVVQPGGGAGGGGIRSSDSVAFSGAIGSRHSGLTGFSFSAGGVSPGGSATSGSFWSGGGGGAATAVLDDDGGDGADGVGYGSGGGGGGACKNGSVPNAGNRSGNGGDGQDGIVIIVSFG